MNSYVKIEQLHFDSDINTVDMDTYPASYPLHWHQHVECIAIAKPDSTVVVSINQRHVIMKSGDLFFIMPGELHEIVDNSQKAIIAIQFPLSLLTSKREFATYQNFIKDNYYLSYDDRKEVCDTITEYINRIIDISADTSDRFRNTKMTINLYEMVISAVNMLSKPNAYESRDPLPVNMTGNSNIEAKIGQACSYIKTHCTEQLSLEEVARHVGFSPCYFSRHFKRVTTHSFVEYLLLQRINRFQSLLSDSSISITEAAYQAGFKSISTLNRAFTKYCGCSPREFRSMYGI